MKTKRTLFSIVVFLSVFWISIILGFDNSSYNSIEDEKPQKQSSDNNNLKAISGYFGDVASNSNRLHLYEERYGNTQTDKITNGINGSHNNITKEEIISDLSSDEKTEDEEDINEESEPKAAQSIYSDIGISIANSYVNIRDKATTDSEIKGKLYKDAAAKILDTVGDWYYIESGSVKGYIKSEYLKTDIPDEELIEKYGKLRISVNTDGLNVRKNPDTDSERLTVIYKNEYYPVLELMDEWIKIDISDDKIVGYVSREYVELLVDFKKAVSKEEEEELKKLQEKERSKKETEIKYRDKVNYTEDELKLLACLVHAEAGNQSYEGKLAVANVVLNRVKSRKYPNTIKDVIYQPGQFSVAKSGSLAKQLTNYDNYSSKSQLLTIKAAKAALSGENNIGNRLYFNEYKAAVKRGYDKKKNSVKIEDHLFW